MQTAIFTGPRQIEVREMDAPALKPSQILLRVRAVGLCTMEQRFYRGVAPGDYPFRGGHEVAAEVVEIGPAAITDARVGDLVAPALLTRCGVCYYCRRGMDNFCLREGARQPGEMWGPAGLSEHIAVEDYQVYKPAVPRDPCELALTEPLACVVRSVSLPPLQFGDTVVVQGAGIMGLLHVQLLKQRGVRVIVAEPDARRRAFALRQGADDVLDPLAENLATFVKDRTDGRGANAVFFTAGGPAAIEQALIALDKGGWLCLYGSVHPKGPLPVDPNLIHYNEITVTGTYSHTRDSFRQAIALISNGMADLSCYISERAPYSDIVTAFERAISPGTYRVVVTFDTNNS